jgi:GDP-L-fucose synthase
MLKGKRILVTGGAGFIGSNLIKRLLDYDVDIVATLHQNNPKILNSRIAYIACDLQNPNDCQRVCCCIDYIFLCAANTSGAAVMETTPLVHLTPNLIMNANMLEAAYTKGVKKVLFLSSNSVYPVTDYPVVEEDAKFDFFEKYFIVGWMKAFSEKMCEMYATKIRKPMTTIVIRPGNVYGPLDDFAWETSHVLPALIRRVVERHNPISVWGDGNDIKDFIYVDDLVYGLILAMEQVETFDIFNIAGGQPYALKELLNLMLSIVKYKNAKIEFDTSKPTMIPKRLININKAKRVLGFTPTTSIDVGLNRTIEWYRRTIHA